LGRIEIRESILKKSLSVVSLTSFVISFIVSFIRLAFGKEFWRIVMDLRRLIASSCRQKILEALSTVRQTYVTDLVRRINSTYGQVNRNLQILEHEGIVKIQYYGRLRMIKLNRENPKTITLLKVLKLLRE